MEKLYKSFKGGRALRSKNIRNTVDEFINAEYGYFNPDEDGTYRPKIFSFYNFLTDEMRLSSSQSEVDELEKIDLYAIEKSMDYYIEESKKKPNKKYHVTKISTLDNYFTVIRRYFKFLHKNKITNRNLILEFTRLENNIYELNEFINKVALRNNLIKKEVKEPYKPKIIESMLKACSKTIVETDELEMFRKKKDTGYKHFTSAIILKLIYYTGIKYRVIKTIDLKDVNINSCTIKLFKYEILIPKAFMDEIELYIKVRNTIANKKEKRLFVKSSFSATPYSNSYICDYLNKIVNKSNTTGLAKVRIIEMMERGIPEIVIKELTTFESAVLDDCKRYLSQDYFEDYSFINNQLKETFNTIV